MSQTVTQADWKTLIRHWIASDVRDLLPQVKTPTLVLHPRQVLQPRPEESMNLAAHIPNARFMATDGAMQLGDPSQGLAAIDAFLDDVPQGGQPVAADSRDAMPVPLSSREIEVLRLLASGVSSREIAESLTLSVRTVERHIGNIYFKTNTHGRVQATAYAIAHRLV